jgi:hypothetical protein
MLFLLNAVVLQIPHSAPLPRGLGRLARTTPAGALKAGAELYARYPRLDHQRPDIAEWYCLLLAAKFPDAGGALFERGPSGYVGRLAEIPFALLATLWRDQRGGRSIEADVQRLVWAPARAQVSGVG